MSAPIGRLRVRPTETRPKRVSGGPWEPADPPSAADVTEEDESARDGAPPSFYPFPLKRAGG